MKDIFGIYFKTSPNITWSKSNGEVLNDYIFNEVISNLEILSLKTGNDENSVVYYSTDPNLDFSFDFYSSYALRFNELIILLSIDLRDKGLIDLNKKFILNCMDLYFLINLIEKYENNYSEKIKELIISLPGFKTDYFKKRIKENIEDSVIERFDYITMQLTDIYLDIED